MTVCAFVVARDLVNELVEGLLVARLLALAQCARHGCPARRELRLHVPRANIMFEVRKGEVGLAWGGIWV